MVKTLTVTTKLHPDVQARFAAHCADLMEIMVGQAREKDPWKIYLAKGAGDRAIAGDHEERHLLELLQNARDAIFRGRLEGNQEPGRVLIGVTDQGLAVANTGSPFHLDDENVLEAVRFLMRSDKVGTGYIGHKGIGLKSILLRAGAFSVRTRLNGETLQATFSRYRSTCHLLDRMDAAPGDFFSREDILEELPRLPLFTQPHPDTTDPAALGEETVLIDALIDGGRSSSIGLSAAYAPTTLLPYTTVVYLPYRDAQWEQLLDEVDAGLPAARRARFRREREQMRTSRRGGAEALWQEVMALDPRVLVLLGEILEVQFVRFSHGAMVAARRIDIDAPLSPLQDEGETLRRIELRYGDWERSGNGTPDVQRRAFTILSHPTRLGAEEGETNDAESQEHVRILLEVPAGNTVTLRNEPLFLYYPIDASPSGLPFLIHGPFRVNSSRTDLAPSECEHNRQVLAEAIELLAARLDQLLDERPLRRWLPWILLPQVASDAESASARDQLQRELVDQVLDLLREATCVPITRGCARPSDVHFLPDQPEALALLESLDGDERAETKGLRLLTTENRETYQQLHQTHAAHWQQAARAIGLGQMDRQAFVEALAAHLQRANRDTPWWADAGRVRAFFLGLCNFLVNEAHKVDDAAASILGQARVPLLPVSGSNKNGHAVGGQGDVSYASGDTLLLIPTEPRETGKGATEKARRVVFWYPASVEARAEQLPPPPSVIPVYFIDPAVVGVAPTESVLSRVGRAWGTAQFEGRPDLFRRVADEAAGVTGQEITPVLGYLAGLLQSIRSVSFSSAEDLVPRPYAAIDRNTLRNLLSVYHRSTNQRVIDRQRLESLQAWAHIPVPVQTGDATYSAHLTAFGLEWAEMLERAVAQLQSGQEEEAEREETDREEMVWATAIRALSAFRQQVGRPLDHPDYPEIAPPDDPRWAEAYAQLRDVLGEQVAEDEAGLPQETRERLALFRLLLLLGVRIGPRVAWRWLNRVSGAEDFQPQTQAISKGASSALWKGQDTIVEILPDSLCESDLMKAYRDFLSLQPYHPLYSGEHATSCRNSMIGHRDVPKETYLAAWIWFPDLVKADLHMLPFECQLHATDAFRDALLAAWSSGVERVLWTGWYCESGHSGRAWKSCVPSLAAFQLLRLPLWQAREDGRAPDLATQRFPAAVMIAWNKDASPTATEPAAFLPMLDTQGAMEEVADALQVHGFGNLNLLGALFRLRWLLEASKIGEGPDGCWKIAEFANTSRDAWLAAQYRLLSRIVLEHDPDDPWHRRAALTCGLVLRAVRDEDQWAVPVVRQDKDVPAFARDVAFFTQSPRRWEREAHADAWLLETQQRLETAFHRWARMLGAEELRPEPPPAYRGTPVQHPDAVATLRFEVQERLDLILGTFQAQQEGQLSEAADKILAALETMVPVQTPPGYAAEVGWSGLDANRRLVFSIDDYRRERQEGRSGTAVLAEGLALVVGRTDAVSELQHALSAPEDAVRRLLRFRGVDLDSILQQVTTLARKRLDLLLARVADLIEALGTATGTATPIPDWHLDVISEGEWVAAIEALKAAADLLADQALAAMHAAAPDLPVPALEDLLCSRVSEDPALREPLPLARRLLRPLRDAGWSTAKRARFLKAGWVTLPENLAEHQETVRAALNSAVVAALAGQLLEITTSGTEDVEQALTAQGQAWASDLRVPPTQTDNEFLSKLKDMLGAVKPDLQSHDLLMVEWDESMWHGLSETCTNEAEALLSEVSRDWSGLTRLLRDCLGAGSLAPLQEHHHREINERRARLNELEHKFETGLLAFSPEALTGTTADSALGAVTSETSEPGRRGGGQLPTVTVNQGLRGRVAELFVLEVCWRRFLALDAVCREHVLDLIATYRQKGPGDVPWGTVVAWGKLERRLSAHRAALLRCADGDADIAGLAQVFKALIEVAGEQGPGFDVLDPFGEWGTENGSEPAARRVEIKAILPPDESSEGHRVVLTTNEFHRARQHPASYILRLIVVPQNLDDASRVRWVGDIPDPVGVLNLEARMVQGVRSGTLPFLLRQKL
ncbi:MAG: hypothetical protein JXC32_08470 [Anaerolineae bacterium]|nr:hypothetical protein [Anaerolineae bacterium]